MASTIKLKNGSGAPLAADLVTAEPALDLTNKRLYTEDSLGNVIEVGTNPTSLTTGDITTTGAVDVTGDLDVDNINIDGNAITSTDTNGNITITPNGTGEVDISKVDIDSGTIDGTTIGGTTTAAGSFTTLQADTSLNVDGTVTADGLTVEGASLTVDNGYGITSVGAVKYIADSDNNAPAAGLIHQFFTDNGTTLAATIAKSGDISFYEDTGTTAKFFWDASAERLGIGTTSPDFDLTIGTTSDSSTYIALKSDATSGQMGVLFGDSDSDVGYITYHHSTNSMQFGTNASEAMRIDSSGNVGIGTSSPSALVEIAKDDRANGATLRITNSAASSSWTSGDIVGTIDFYSSDSSDADVRSRIQSVSTAGATNPASVDLTFSTFSGSTLSEAMRIDSSGKVGIGQTVYAGGVYTGAYLTLAGFSSTNTGNIPLECYTSSTATRFLVSFSNPNAVVGSISTSGSATSYNTSSDYRLKENVVDMTGAVDRVKALNPSQFNFIADPDKTVDGFLAHEVSDVVPEAVTGTKDAMRTEEYEVTPAVLDEEGNVVTEAVMGTREVPDYQGIDQSKLVPLLTGALQEAIARIETLEAQVATLQGN